MGRLGQRLQVLQVAGCVVEVGGRDERHAGAQALSEGRGRDADAVRRRDPLHVELAPGQPLVPQGREVQLADQDLQPARGRVTGDARSQRR